MATNNADSDSSDSAPIARARKSCDICRRMKIKCERQGESCAHCIDRGFKCETTVVARKKPKAKRGDELLRMEKRIKRLEALIAASGLDSQPSRDQSSSDADTSTSAAEFSQLTDRFSTLVVNEQGSSRFIGPASGFSLFSPQGLHWISEKTGSSELAQFISRLSKTGKPASSGGEAALWQAMPASEREPTPPKHIADVWVQCYFDTFNAVIPLYDKATFDRYYALQFTATPPQDTAWYASLNVILAIGLHITMQLRSKTSSEAEMLYLDLQHWKFLRNATSCFVELMFNDTSLMTVQAVCGLSYLKQMNLQPHQAYLLTSAAGRLAHAIGLHRKLDGFGLSQTEINQRRNVFWNVYIMDKSIALRLGHPSVINDDDIEVDLPEDSCVIEAGSKLVDIFRCRAELAQLEGRTYNNLYSSGARRRSEMERMQCIGQLDKELEAWRLSVPFEIRPGEPICCAPEPFPPVFLMHFAYFNALSTVHRSSIYHTGSWTHGYTESPGATPQNNETNPRVYASQSICLSAARKSIQIIHYVDTADSLYMDKIFWTELYYPLSAFLILFANALENPMDASISSDLQLMDLVISILSPMMGEVSPFSATTAFLIFQELRKVVKDFIEKTSSTSTKVTKRSHDHSEPQDDEIKPLSPLYPNSINEGGTGPLGMAPWNSHSIQNTNVQPFPLQSFTSFENGSIYPRFPDDMMVPDLNADTYNSTQNFEWDIVNLQGLDFLSSLDKMF